MLEVGFSCSEIRNCSVFGLGQIVFATGGAGFFYRAWWGVGWFLCGGRDGVWLKCSSLMEWIFVSLLSISISIICLIIILILP